MCDLKEKIEKRIEELEEINKNDINKDKPVKTSNRLHRYGLRNELQALLR